MSNPVTIDPKTLPSAEELQSRKAQLEKEVQVLKTSFEQLLDAQNRFAQNVGTLVSLKSASVGQELLVPLTASVMVPARLAANDTVLVDIGTGYVVEKSISEADHYYERKVNFLQQQLEALDALLQERRQNLSIMGQALAAKLQLAGQE